MLGAGLRGPAVEQALASHGLTLGHFPQSWEYATLGGWVATRSAGQASTGYGASTSWSPGCSCVAPAGEIELRAHARDRGRAGAAAAAGGLGGRARSHHRGNGEGAAAAGGAAHYEGWMFHGFEQGAEAFRALEQGHVDPDVARLSDEAETRLSMTLSEDASLRAARGPRYIGARRYASGCIAILGLEGTRQDVDVRAGLRAAHHAPRAAAWRSAPARAGLAAPALRGAVPARRAARPRHHGGDARDGGAVVGPARPLHGGRRRDRRARSRGAARRGG